MVAVLIKIKCQNEREFYRQSQRRRMDGEALIRKYNTLNGQLPVAITVNRGRWDSSSSSSSQRVTGWRLSVARNRDQFLLPMGTQCFLFANVPGRLRPENCVRTEAQMSPSIAQTQSGLGIKSTSSISSASTDAASSSQQANHTDYGKSLTR